MQKVQLFFQQKFLGCMHPQKIKLLYQNVNFFYTERHMESMESYIGLHDGVTHIVHTYFNVSPTVML